MITLFLTLCVLVHTVLGYTVAERTKQLGYYGHKIRQNSWNTPVNDSIYAFSISDPSDCLGGVRGVDRYNVYNGNGMSGVGGWPAVEQWVSFEEMFRNNKPKMRASCAIFAPGTPHTDDDELLSIYLGIQVAAHTTFVDHRVILAVLLQESGGCVRTHNKTITARPPNLSASITFPGLMQPYNGTLTCNTRPPQPAHPEVHTNKTIPIPYPDNVGISTPCPMHEIFGMISEGVVGRHSLVGMLNDIKIGYGGMPYGKEEAYTYYQAVRWYAERKGGTIPAIGAALEQVYYSDPCYTSDIANRLTSWVNAERVCDLKPVLAPGQVVYVD